MTADPEPDNPFVSPALIEADPQPAFRRLAARLEVDRAVAYGVLVRLWQVLAGPVTLVLIAKHFTPELQGFYYTFGSILALQSFLELGFYVVILNVATHEWAELSLNEKGQIVGPAHARARLISLGQFAFKWYGVMGALFVVGVGYAGHAFFSQEPHPEISWQQPWVALVLLTGLLLWTLPFNSLLEGCHQVAQVNKLRLYQAALGNISVWIAVAMGWGLWAAVLSTAVRLLCDLYLLGVKYRHFFRPFFAAPPGPGIQWQKEVLPMQWRLALSGVVNYFAYSLYTPVMFQFHGEETAGRMGMALSLINALQQAALAWVQAKVPRFGALIAKRQYAELDRLFWRTSLISVLVVAAGAIVLMSALFVLDYVAPQLAERILPPLPLAIMLVGTVLMQISQCQSAYLRAHKREPLLLLSVLSGIGIGLAVWLLGRAYGPTGAAVGYLAVVALFVVPYETYLFYRLRSAWHQ